MAGVPQHAANIIAEINAMILPNNVESISGQKLNQILNDIAVSYQNILDGTTAGPVTNPINAVVDFKCDNTGGTNTSTTLQAAITAAVSSSRPLYVPAGLYDCGAVSLSVTGSLEMYGAGRTQTVIQRSQDSSVAPLFAITGANVRLRDFSCSYTANTTSANVNNAAAIASSGGNVKYENLDVHGAFYMGLIFSSIANGWADKCLLYGGIKNICIYSTGVSSNILVSECFMDGNTSVTAGGFSAFANNLGTQTRVSVIGSIAQNMSGFGFEVNDLIYTSAFLGCHASGITAGPGFFATNTNHSSARTAIMGCSAILCQIGIEFFGTIYGAIVGCKINGSTVGGILVEDSKNCNVSANECDANTGDGIQDVGTGAGTCAQNVYTGNQLIGNTTFGMVTSANSDRIIFVSNVALTNSTANTSLSATNAVSANNITA